MLDRYIRGTRAVYPYDLNRLIRKAKLHRGLQIGELWMPRGTEAHHTLMIGSPGSGKTTLMFQFLYQLRQINAQVLLVDFKGDFISTFYNPETDIIINPFDHRSALYSITSEGKNLQAAESISFSIVQEDYGSANRFFVDAAQAVVAETIMLAIREGKTSNSWFWKTLTSPLAGLAMQLDGTEAGAHLDPAGERTAHSVRSTVLNHTRIFKYMPDPHAGEEVFSIREWVRSGRGGFCFVALKPSLRQLGKSLASLLFDQAALELLEMPDQQPGEFPRLFLMIDEAPQLQRLPLVGNLATLRSKGGAAVLGIQSFSQLKAIYGSDDAASLANYCGHHVIFRTKEPETQDWCSRLLGSAEVYQVTEGLTMGELNKGDRSSRNEQRREIRSVLGAQLKDLPDRYCWVSLSGNWPISMTEIPRVARPQYHAPFVERQEVDLSGELRSQENDDPIL
ncbi:type IV secretion system DNA-binding domain-containing protein [bacterium]|nr:type IV secretion system DNA-binding domain-containing protein [bacterium]